jgi:hypothetical protein
LKQRKTLIVVTPDFPESEADTRCLPAFQQFVGLLKKTEYNIIVFSLYYFLFLVFFRGKALLISK